MNILKIYLEKRKEVQEKYAILATMQVIADRVVKLEERNQREDTKAQR